MEDNGQVKKLSVKSILNILNKGGVFLGFLGLSIIISILTPNFLTASNIINVLRQITFNAILAFGITFVIIMGGIDLSVGSIVAVSGTFTAGLIADGMSISFAIIIGLLIGVGFGLFNGVLSSPLGMPPFIVTLATMTIARGVAYIYSKGMPIRTQIEHFNFIGNGHVGFVPFPVVILLSIFLISYFLLHKTVFGRYAYSIGGNRIAARYAGIKIFKIEIIGYVISGVFAALVGIILSARMYSGQPTVGVGFELDAIAAVVLGGTSFSGGIGTMVGTMFGALIIGVMNNGLNLLNVPFYYQLIIKGVVIICAIYFDTMKKKKKHSSSM